MSLTSLVLPSGFAFALFVLGILARTWTRTRAASWPLLALSGFILLVFSSGKVATLLMSPLEYSSATVHDGRQYPNAKHIVVLTGWASHDSNMPLSGRMNASSAYRVLMGLELFRQRPDCDVIVTGEAVAADVMAAVMAQLGVPSERIKIESKSKSTAQSAEHIRALVGKDDFLLVTSGGHMPRALAAMASFGLRAIPVPTDHQGPKSWRDAEWQPRPESLAVSDLAVHEYLGRLWYAMRGTG